MQKLRSRSDSQHSSTFPSNLVRIGAIVMKWHPVFEIQDGGRRHLELRKYAFCCKSYVQGQILNILTKFGEDRSNSNEMATGF